MPDLHLLTGAYALDALDDVERTAFERHLSSCGTCSAEVIELQEAAAGLAARVSVEPPERLRASVMAQVARTRQVSPTERVQLRRPSLRRFVATGAAAAVLAGTAALGGVAWQNHQDANHSKIVAARAAELTRVLTDPDHRETVAESSVGGTATVFAAQGKAVLALNQLPAPPRGKTYQVWRIDRNAVIGSAGLLDLTAGRGQQLISGVSPGDTIALSVEPSGGSKQPTTQPVVTVKVA